MIRRRLQSGLMCALPHSDRILGRLLPNWHRKRRRVLQRDFGNPGVPIMRYILNGKPCFFVLILFIGPRRYPVQFAAGKVSGFPGSIGSTWATSGNDGSIDAKKNGSPSSSGSSRPPAHTARSWGCSSGIALSMDSTTAHHNDKRSEHVASFAATAIDGKAVDAPSVSGSPTTSDASASPPGLCGRFSNVPSLAASSLPSASPTASGANEPSNASGKRFDLGQSRIRTALLSRGPPPVLPTSSSPRPVAAQVLAHLQATFPHADCPIAAFQQGSRSFFI